MSRLAHLVLFLCISPDDLYVLGLASEDWRQRDAAEAALRRRGFDARYALKRGMQRDDPEVRRRCSYLYYGAIDDVMASFEPVPMIDSLWYDADAPHPGYRCADARFQPAYERFDCYLDRAGSRDGYPYANYYRATRLMLRDLLDAGVHPDVLRLMVAEMRRRDAVYLRDYSNPPAPPPP